MSFIQLYCKIEDIQPTEHWIIDLPDDPNSLVDPAEKILYETNGDCLVAWREDIRQKGILNQLKIHPTGLVGDGNSRYWCSRDLYQNTDNQQFGYLPIDLSYFLGLEYDGGKLCLRTSLLTESNPYIKRPINPPRKNFPIVEYKDLARGTNPHSYIRPKLLTHFREI